MDDLEQGKSEGFESCDRPIVRKRPILVKIGDVLSRVTLKFDGWPWKILGHLSFAVSSFVQHFITICEFKLELQSGNAQFGSNSTIFKSRVTLKFDGWPWKTIGHLYYATSSFVHHFVAISDSKLEIQSGNTQFGSKSTIFRAMHHFGEFKLELVRKHPIFGQNRLFFLAVWPCNSTYDLEKQ